MEMAFRIFRTLIFPALLYAVMPTALGYLLIEKYASKDRSKFLYSEVKLCRNQLAASNIRRSAMEAVHIRKEIGSTNALLACMKKIIKESEAETKRMSLRRKHGKHNKKSKRKSSGKKQPDRKKK